MCKDAKEDWKMLTIGGIQQAIAAFAGITMVPLIILRAIGCDAAGSVSCVSIAMLICGVSTFLQCARIGFIGSGYLLIMGTSSMFIAPSIMAGKIGGPALIFGMVMLMSPVEFIVAPLAKYLRKLIPTFVPAVMVLLLAFSVLPVSIRQFGGGYGPDFCSWRHLVLGGVTLVAIVAAQRSPWQWLKTGSIVWGVIFGYIIGTTMGLVDASSIASSGYLGAPRPFWYGLPKFSWAMVLPFGLAYLLTAIETFGDLHAIAHVNGDNDIDNRRISGGLSADALGSLLSGLFGTMANTTFSGNVAIAGMSGVRSPKCGYIAAALFVLLSFMPKLSAVIAAMPAAVLGASMLVACAFLMNVSLQMLKKCQERDLLPAAIGITAGLGMQMLPEFSDKLPAFLAQFLKSSVCVGTLFAVAAGIISTGLQFGNKNDKK